MRLNISQINLYQKCPEKWRNRYVLGQEKAGENATLKAGTIFHLGMEGYFARMKAGSTHREAADMLSLFLLNESEAARIEGNKKLAIILVDLADKAGVMPVRLFYDPAKVIGVEKVIEMPMGRHTLVGRLDAIVTLDANENSVWHVQNRTLALGTSMDSYIESRKMDPHELAYGALLRHAYPALEVGGTITNFVKKGGNPAPTKWYEEMVPWSEERWTAFEYDAISIANEMAEIKNDYRKARKNRTECRSSWGGLCPYFEVCANGASITGPDFVHVEPEYFEESNEQ